MSPGITSPEAALRTFDEICRSVCESLDQAMPTLASGESARTLALRVDGVDASLLQTLTQSHDCAIVRAHLGALSRIDDLTDVTAMMDANFRWLSQRHGTRFGRAASSGAVFVQCAFPLAGTTASQLLGQLTDLASCARTYRLVSSDTRAPDFATANILRVPSQPYRVADEARDFL